MQRILLSSLAFVAFGTTCAMAADMVVKAPVYKAPVPVVDMWTGFYVGANIGYGAGGWNAASNQRVFDFESTTANPNVKGLTAGIQAGYNWRINPQWLLGIEADIQDPLKAGQTWSDPGLGIPCGDCPPPRRLRPASGRPSLAVA
jgi:outer membrane immunogenic protein